MFKGLETACRNKLGLEKWAPGLFFLDYIIASYSASYNLMSYFHQFQIVNNKLSILKSQWACVRFRLLLLNRRTIDFAQKVNMEVIFLKIKSFVERLFSYFFVLY